MANSLYRPLGTIEVLPNYLWTVDIKQPFPIEGPYYDLAGCLLKPTLKRQSSNAPIDLEIELMSPVDPKTPLQVGVCVETFAPPSEKSVVHSLQRRNVTMSDCSRVIEIKIVMMAERWEAAKGLCVSFKFEPIQQSKPLYRWLWNSDTSKDVEIHFQDPQISPVLVHKDFILEHCSSFMNLVQVGNSNSNNASDGGDSGDDILTLPHTSDRQDLTRAGGHSASPSLGSATPTSTPGPSTPRMPPLSAAANDKKQSTMQEAGLLSPLEDRSDISNHLSMGSSFVDVQSPSSNSPKDDLSVTGSERDWEMAEFLAQASGGNSGLGTIGQQPGVKALNRKETKKARKNANAVASGTASPVDVKSSPTNLEQQEREKTPCSPLTHNSLGLKITTAPPRPQQQQQQQQLAAASQSHVISKKDLALHPGREIWYWTDKLHPEICTFILRWLYLEEIPTCTPDAGCGGGVFSFSANESLLKTFSKLNTPRLFQRFLASQLQCIRQHKDQVSLWSASELAQKGTLIHRFFRPTILETSYDNISKIIWSQAFASLLGPSDPSGIIRDIIDRQHPTATRRQ
ncbi:hypothetical protein BGX24_000528 [Mortierella sp. AD032]|nr:hypothetical protein BGX24_000528 [Mortierella sp. AD032]